MGADLRRVKNTTWGINSNCKINQKAKTSEEKHAWKCICMELCEMKNLKVENVYDRVF